MRLLIVAMANSIHSARWISQINDQGWEIHVFPSTQCHQAHSLISGVHCHFDFYPGWPGGKFKVKGIPVFFPSVSRRLNQLVEYLFPSFKAWRLRSLIAKIRPDIIHSLEIQSAGYLTLKAKKNSISFPVWWVTNWGSDIFYFQHYETHKQRIQAVMQACDYYSCECERDIQLAKQFGFEGKHFAVKPNAGGLDLECVERLGSRKPASLRRVIMLKGYHAWQGRALIVIQALMQLRQLLSGYTLCIYSACPSVVNAAEDLERQGVIPVAVIPKGTPHNEILKLHAQARISIANNVTDGINTSFLEAIAMGSFPIQSNTSCANEWVTDGETGFFIPPEDVRAIEKAIRKALLDDQLVDAAQKINQRTVRERLDQKIIKSNSIRMYRQIISEQIRS